MKSGAVLLRNIWKTGGSLGGAAVWRLPLAQGAILETRDRVPPRAPGAWSLLLPLPVSLSLSLSHCVPIINKLKKKKKNVHFGYFWKKHVLPFSLFKNKVGEKESITFVFLDIVSTILRFSDSLCIYCGKKVQADFVLPYLFLSLRSD